MFPSSMKLLIPAARIEGRIRYLCSVCIDGLKDLRVCAFLSRQDSIVLAFGLGQFKESPHPPHPLQGAHLLLGFLLNLLLAVSGKPYLEFELRLLRLSRGIELRELDASGNEGLSYDEYRALLGHPRWQVGDCLGDTLDDEVSRRWLLFIGHSSTTTSLAPPRPPRLHLIARVVGLGVVLVCVPPEHSREKAVSAHACLPPSALIYLPLGVILLLFQPL